METIVDFYVELVNFTESNISRIDTRLNSLVDFTEFLYNFAFGLFVFVLVLAYMTYKLRKRNEILQEQIIAVQREVREALNPFIYS